MPTTGTVIPERPSGRVSIRARSDATRAERGWRGCDQPGERDGGRAVVLHAMTAGMGEAQPDRVQAHPAERIAGGAVGAIAHDRMTEGGQLRADLTAAPGHQRQREPGRRRPSLRDPVIGDGFASARAIARWADAARATLTQRGPQSAAL